MERLFRWVLMWPVSRVCQQSKKSHKQMDEIYLCGHSQTERFCYHWIEIIVVALASRHCSEVLFSSYLFTLSTSHTVCIVIVWENPFWLKWMLTKQHFISFPICEKFVTSRYKIPGRLKGFKRKHIVLGVCLFLSVNFFLSTLKTMFVYFCIRICMTLFRLPSSSPKIVWRIRYWLSRGYLKLF